jgi:hypothetical protein
MNVQIEQSFHELEGQVSWVGSPCEKTFNIVENLPSHMATYHGKTEIFDIKKGPLKLV